MPPVLDELVRAWIKEAVSDTVREVLHDFAARGVSLGAGKQRLLNVDQAAAHIGRSRAGVRHLIAMGKIPVVRIDRRVSIDVRDLEQFIEDSKS